MSRVFWEKIFVEMHKDHGENKAEFVHFAEIPAPHSRGRPAQEGIRKMKSKSNQKGILKNEIKK